MPRKDYKSSVAEGQCQFLPRMASKWLVAQENYLLWPIDERDLFALLGV